MNKFFRVILPIFLFVFIMQYDVNAMEIDSLYAHTTSNSSNAVNLLNLASNYDSFRGSDFVIFQDSQYSYYIVWGDLDNEADTVSGGNIEYIHYYRESSSSYNSNYNYLYGYDDSFRLDTGGYFPCSNLKNFGFRSVLYEEYCIYENVNGLLLLAVSFFFVIMLCNLRRQYS